MNKKVDALLEDFFDNGEFISIIIEKPISYIAITLDGLVGVGMMRCMPSDTFDRHFGYSNALRKALKDICEQREKIERTKREHEKAEKRDTEYIKSLPVHEKATHLLELIKEYNNV